MARPALTWFDRADKRPRRVAIGEFDGVHLGHRALLPGADTVLTFHPHPLAVVAPARAPRMLTRLDDRARILLDLGVKEVIVVAFGPRFAARPAGVFIDEDLIDRLGAQSVCVGRNFRFGRGAAADVEVLRRHPGIEARIVDMVCSGDEVISSTRVRRLVAAGDVAAAGELLGRPLELPVQLVAGGDGLRVSGSDPELIRPGPGRYECELSDGHGRWQAAEVYVPPEGSTPDRPALREEVSVRFLRRAAPDWDPPSRGLRTRSWAHSAQRPHLQHDH